MEPLSSGKSNMNRVIVYIDGFNLYFGLKSKGWQRYYWLNLRLLSQNLLERDQALVKTKYFTSRVRNPAEKAKRQNTFIEALETLNDFEIYYGHYLVNSIECPRCRKIIPRPNEKMTDVNIAVEMLSDAFQDRYDTAILISADSDLSGPIRKAKALFPAKRFVVAFPPERTSYELMKLADASFVIGRKKLADSLFPDEVRKTDGFVLRKPERWQ
jgi:uncharacterized LabA/DUF88 family protein